MSVTREQKELLVRGKVLNFLTEVFYAGEEGVKSIVSLSKEHGISPTYAVCAKAEKLTRQEGKFTYWDTSIKPNIYTAKTLQDRVKLYNTKAKGKERTNKKELNLSVKLTINKPYAKTYKKVADDLDIFLEDLNFSIQDTPALKATRVILPPVDKSKIERFTSGSTKLGRFFQNIFKKQRA